MRRVLVSVTMLSLLVVGMALRVGGAGAQQATPAAVSLPVWVEAWITALETEDPHGFADLYLNDGTYEDVAAGMSVHDRFSIVEVAAMYMASQDDFTITPIAFHQANDWAVLEYSFSGTDPLDKPFQDIRAATVFELSPDGRIKRSTDYYDSLDVDTQLGVVATPVP